MSEQSESHPESQSDQEDVEAAVEQEAKKESSDEATAEADIEQALVEAQNKAEENWQLYMRSQAELENTKRRADRNVENAHKFGLEKFGMELLSVKDSLELGLSVEDSDAAKLKEGTNLTLKMLTQVMEKFSIMEVNPVGEAFDPNLHQAMSMQESAEHQPNTVIAVMQKGYVLNDRLLRPAMVMVSKAPS
ncbi:MAG: nucleotide exchange factor GrpE [Gammaproteobacteria bacterium]|nr:nucleotide exchange factor GrpE [Gammaproteobacteria bacterium]